VVGRRVTRTVHRECTSRPNEGLDDIRSAADRAPLSRAL
jgi:hypothetical protein